MGFFSWETSDTKESISNNMSIRGPLEVYLICPDNSYYHEEDYEGYGVFGGRDAYALLAQWNVPEQCKDKNGNWLSDDELRHIGIEISHDTKLKFPLKFATDIYEYDDLEPSERCELQGFFYDDEEEEEEVTYCTGNCESCSNYLTCEHREDENEEDELEDEDEDEFICNDDCYNCERYGKCQDCDSEEDEEVPFRENDDEEEYDDGFYDEQEPEEEY